MISSIYFGETEEDEKHFSVYHNEPLTRNKILKQGPRPRGPPDLYYTSRVLKSTARYEQFIKKLRASEKELKQLEEEKLKNAEDQHYINFFKRCERRSILRTLKDRFDFCMRAYEDDLQVRREKLIRLYNVDEEVNAKKLAQVIYEGRDAAWLDTTDRLAYLLAKRKKEIDDKFKSNNILSKCLYELPSVHKQRCQDTEKIWGYQIQEKQMRKMADKEMDNMWHAVLMKETEALRARMDYEAIDRFRRDSEAKMHTDQQIAARRMERARLQEKLKQQTLLLKAKFEEDRIQEEEEKRQCRENYQQRLKDTNDMIKERKEIVTKQITSAKRIDGVWASLANQYADAENVQKERRKQQKQKNVECNLKLVEQKHQFAKQKEDNVPLIQEEYERREDTAELKRNQLMEQSQKATRESRTAIVQQIKEKKLARQNYYDESIGYRHQLSEQLNQLVKHKELTDTQAKMLYYKDLHGQMEYNKQLTERARQAAQDEIKKYELATKEYEKHLLLYRPNYGTDHPFMKQISRMTKNSNAVYKTEWTCLSKQCSKPYL